ncbi:MAG: hypothetical protein WB440_13540 [Steroidobacteraceae bacterium]
MLQEMGCEYGQGYYFSEPLEVEPALLRLRSQQPFDPPKDPAETMMIRPLDTSETVMILPLENAADTPAARTHDSAETMKVRPLDPGETMKVRPLKEDESPTIMIPADAVAFPPDEE